MLTRLALRYRILTVGLMLAVMAAGAYSLTRLQIELFPDIDFPLVTVSAVYPQAPPQQVLEEVTIPIEQALEGMGQVDTLQTISAPGVAQIIVLSALGEDSDALEAEVRRRLEGVALPQGVTPQIARIGFDEIPIVDVAIIGDADIAALAGTVRQRVLPSLQAIPGVLAAQVPLGIEDGTTVARANGRPAVNVSIIKDPDANTVEVANAVIAELQRLMPTLPAGTSFIEIANQGPQVQASIDELTQKLVLGGVFAIVVMFAFLLSVRPTLVASVSIPVSVLAALLVMDLQGMTLNILTLGGLAIAVGRVVDDSIVVMENTFRHIQNGEQPRLAALNAAREVAMPITASTLTTIAVFAPLAFMGGFVGTFFVPFALTITYSLLASLVVALTVVPVLAALFISKAREHKENWLERAYTAIVRSALARRWRTLGIAAALTLSSFVMLPFIAISFLPGGGEAVLSIQVSVPGAADPRVVLAQLDEVEATLESMRVEGRVEAYSSIFGGADLFSGFGASNGARLQVRLSEGSDADAVAEQLRGTLAGEGREVRVSTVAGGMPDSSTLELVLQGDDYPTLVAAANTLTERIAALDGVVNVSNNAIDVGSAPELSAFLPIVRTNGHRSVTINGTITARNTQAINLEIQRILNEEPLPEGVEVVTGGVFADIEEAFRQMTIAMVLGVLLVYAVMALTQRSFVVPFIIILSLPLAFVGAFGGLLVTGRALGLPALMGLLMLIGLVVTNAIVLIAFVEQLRARGLGMYEALVQGGRTRLRPILMTALVTIFVLMPMALEIGAKSGGIIGAELATVVIGGLLTSTALTLVVIPVVYTFLRKKGPKPAKAASEEAPAAVA